MLLVIPVSYTHLDVYKRQVLLGIIGVGKRRDREARQNHDADRKDGQKTKLLTHCRLPCLLYTSSA